MKDYLNIAGDIETIPTQDEALIQRIKTIAEGSDPTPPSGYTKADFGRVLELDANMDKGMDTAGLKAMWVDRFRVDFVEEKFQELYRKTSFSAGEGGEVISASFKIIGNNADGSPIMQDPVTLHRFKGQEDIDEREIITRILRWISSVNDFSVGQGKKIRFVGANISGFDFRFILQRAMIMGIEIPRIGFASSRYSRDTYFDVLDAWNMFDTQAKRPSLDRLCRILGIETPKNDAIGDISGAMVWDIWNNDGQEGAARIAAYNARDAIVLEPIFNIVSQLE